MQVRASQLRDEYVKATTCNLNIFKPGSEVFIKHPNLPRPVAVRVVDLDIDREEVVGTMADISVGGVGVFLKEKGTLKEGDVVWVSFTLPKGKVETQASVRYVLPDGNVYRVGIQYELDLKREKVVSDYVMERQFEILKELRGYGYGSRRAVREDSEQRTRSPPDIQGEVHIRKPLCPQYLGILPRRAQKQVCVGAGLGGLQR